MRETVRRTMRTSRAILVCAAAAISLLAASWWIGSSAGDGPTSLSPQSLAESSSQRESAVLEVPATASSSTREAPLPPGIHGRLVDESTGAPLAGWKIRLECPSEASFVSVLRGMQADAGAVAASNTLTSFRMGLELVSPGNDPAPAFTQFDIKINQDRATDDQAQVMNDVLRIALTTAAHNALQQQPEASPPATTEPLLTDPNQNVAPAEAIATPQAQPSQALADFENAQVVEPVGNALAAADSEVRGTFRVQSLNFQQIGFQPRIEPLDLKIQTAIFDRIVADNMTLHYAPGRRLMIRGMSTDPGDILAGVERGPTPTLLGECTTDADGRFELPCPGRDDAWLRLEPQDPVYPRPLRYTLGRSSSACSTPIVWKVRPVERALVHVRVLDVVTGEPVPDLRVDVRGADTHETCTTDAEGRFTSRKHCATGSIRIAFHDGPEHDEGPENNAVQCDDPRAELTVSEEELVFRVAIGPTFRFTCANDPELVQARVRILHGGPLLSGAWQELRDGDEPFWRSTIPLEGASAAGLTAEIVSVDGFRRARIVLPHRKGRGELIDVAYSLGAQVHGRVLDAEGAAVADVRVDALDARGEVIDGAATDGDGVWRITGLDPRAVAFLRVEGSVGRKSLLLMSGDDRDVDLTLERPPR